MNGVVIWEVHTSLGSYAHKEVPVNHKTPRTGILRKTERGPGVQTNKKTKVPQRGVKPVLEVP